MKNLDMIPPNERSQPVHIACFTEPLEILSLQLTVKRVQCQLS
jgi:hypothetical protein